MTKNEWSRERVRELARAIARGHERGAFERLAQKDWRYVFRAPDGERATVVVKLWARPALTSRLSARFGFGALAHEWKNLRRARAAGLPVPEPLGLAVLASDTAPFTDALVLEDLGRLPVATEHVKACIAAGKERELAAFEAALVELTASFVEAEIVDTDHGLVNTLVDARGAPVRIDLEQARRLRPAWGAEESLGRMLGHLLTTYTFAVQPDTRRVLAFAELLQSRLRPDPGVRRVAREYLAMRLELQTQRTGFEVRVSLPW